MLSLLEFRNTTSSGTSVQGCQMWRNFANLAISDPCWRSVFLDWRLAIKTVKFGDLGPPLAIGLSSLAIGDKNSQIWRFQTSIGDRL